MLRCARFRGLRVHPCSSSVSLASFGRQLAASDVWRIVASGLYRHPFAETLASQSTTRYHEASSRIMVSIESNKLLLAAAAACDDKKAEDIRILALDPAESRLTDYFLICNGTNERQDVAITAEV